MEFGGGKKEQRTAGNIIINNMQTRRNQCKTRRSVSLVGGGRWAGWVAAGAWQRQNNRTLSINMHGTCSRRPREGVPAIYNRGISTTCRHAG